MGVDLDDARDPETETPMEWADSIIEHLESYTEISPSGTGYHVLIEGELPPGRNRRGDVELYETARFFTVTGNHVTSTPRTIESRSDGLRTVYSEHVADEPESADQSSLGDHETTDEPDSTLSLSDEDLLERAREASNGEKFERLWRGDTSGYDSHSEADMALACLLAFWTGGDTTQMGRLFEQSGLHREKWDTQHYGDGSTYGEKTLARAVSVTTDSYSPPAQTDSAATDADAPEPIPEPEPEPEAVEVAEIEEESEESNVNLEGNSPERMKDGETAFGLSVASGDLHERERARIKTILELEEQLRELEAENERLRDERDIARATQSRLEDELTAESDTQTGFFASLRGFFSKKAE
ncbi:phage NrS-1 polymerase family protein [Halorussus halophilus]|uniref:phage NrS-1 polymerase family protein n=1 Tax=Halorussus halophilus TaxID=2650975 RepID=UPI001CE41053|nr:hypothetical protein [Halorussus halophilus]